MLEATEDYQAGRLDAAMAKFEEVIRTDPTQMAAWVTLGWAYWKAGRKADAYALWNRLRSIDPNNSTVYSLLARAAAADGDLAKAIEYNRKSLELSPNQYNVRFDLARALLWSGSPTEAMNLMDKALAEDPNRYDVMLELAKARTFNWQYEQAIPLWAKLRQQAPDDISYMANESLCKLHSGDVETARAEAEKVLESQPADLTALEVMASIEEFGDNPERALPYLRKLMEAQPKPEDKEGVRVRLIRLLVRLFNDQPRVYSLDEAISLTNDRLEYDPKSVDALCLLGELQLMSQKFGPAEEALIKVLREFNPYNIRARRALMETYMAVKEYDRAREQLAALSSFNPLDPYLYYYLARLESVRGDFYAAHQALDRLEQAGMRGSVAVLLYHGLTTSDHFVDALSIKRFRDHMSALQKAGVQFIRTSELPATLKSASSSLTVRGADVPATPSPALGGEVNARRPAARIPITATVTFDDARHDSMRYGTEVAKEFGIPFAMHVPCGYIMRNHPFICGWDELAGYAKEGCWDFGSHFIDAAIVAPIAADGREGHVLPNLMWLPDQKRMETAQEYEQRLSREFPDSRKMLQEKLGGPVNFIAYPFGDIGQEVETNLEDPPHRILKHGRKAYDAGFIQSVFGFAIAGDDPLLYQRHEMDRWRNGEELVDYLYEHHPVFLARRLRAEFAALEGKIYLAQDAIRSLQDGGYPKKPWEDTKKYVNDRLAAKFATPATAGTIKKAPWEIDISKPYIGATGEYFQDNQDRSNWRLLGMVGLNLTPNLVVEGRAGFGAMNQDVQTLDTNVVGKVITLRTRKYSISLDERDVGGRASFTFPNGVYIAGDLLQRSFTGDADKSFTTFGLEGQVRPLQPLDVMLRYEHDLAPSALAVVEDVTYDMYMINANYRLRDWWDLSAAGMRFNFDEGENENTRDHLTLGSMWTVHERTGLKLGLRYSYATTDHDSLAYWTPYNLHRYYVEGGFQGNHLRRYYNLRLRIGLGHEDPSPEEEARYQASVVRAAAQNYDPGPPPGSDWEWVWGAAASTRWPVGEHWVFNGEFSYNKNPNYNEFTLLGGLKYKF